jgi:hypothetical protein
MIVEIPGVGNVEFPDDTPPEVVANAAKDAHLKAVAASNRPFEGQDPAEWKRMKAEAARAGMLQPTQGQGAIDRPVEQDLRDPGAMAALASGVTQGATFGFGDEIAAGLASIAPSITYDQALQTARGMSENAAFARPKTELAGQIIGGATASMGTTGAVLGAGKTLAGKAGLGALSGAIEGGAYGFGTGEGGVANRAENAAKSAAIGGAVGAIAPAAIAAAGMGARAVANPVASALNIPSNVRAGRALETYMGRAGLTADDVAAATQRAAAEGQPQFMAADALGLTGQRALAGIARQPGSAREEIANALIGRQDSQGNRLGSFMADALDAPDTAAARAAALTGARGSAADLAYEAARKGAGPVDVRGAIAVIDDRIGGMQGNGVVGDGIDAKLAGYKAKLAAPAAALKPGETARELSDFDRVLGLKQQIGDDIGAAQRAGRNNEARELLKVQKELDAALEAASAPYRAANDEFAKASRVIEAVDTGKAATSARSRQADTTAAFANMTPEQQAAFRAGYADPTIARIESAAPGVNKARPLRNEKTAAELTAMAKDPELLKRQIARENTMFETSNAALGGSKTADNLADMEDTKALSASLITNLLTGRWGAVGGQALDRLLAGATGSNPATRELIARALMSQDPRAAILPAQNRAASIGRINDIASALARSSALRLGQ